MIPYLIATASLTIVFLARGESWRGWWRWWLAALAIKSASTAHILATGSPALVDGILLVFDPIVLALHCLAVVEIWALLTARLHSGEWLALFGLCSGVAGLAVAAVLGYWAGDTGFSIYSDVRMSVHAAMLAFLLTAGLWVWLHGIRRQRGITFHATMMLAVVGVYVRYDLYRAVSMADWKDAQRWNSILVLVCLCGWLANVLLQTRNTRMNGVQPDPERH